MSGVRTATLTRPASGSSGLGSNRVQFGATGESLDEMTFDASGNGLHIPSDRSVGYASFARMLPIEPQMNAGRQPRQHPRPRPGARPASIDAVETCSSGPTLSSQVPVVGRVVEWARGEFPLRATATMPGDADRERT